MNNKKTKEMVTGALMAAVFGVISAINVYTGTMFDIIFIYLMSVAIAYYTYLYNEKMAVLVWLTSTVILFVTGELFFTIYSFFTLPLGIVYVYCQRRGLNSKWFLRLYGAFKNFIVLFLLGNVLGLNVLSESEEIYSSISGLIPFIKGSYLKDMMVVILWLFLSYAEAYIIKVYTNLFIIRMNKNKMMK